MENVLDRNHRYYKCICRGCQKSFGLDEPPYRRPNGCGHYMCWNCLTRMEEENLGCLGCDAEGKKPDRGNEGEFTCTDSMLSHLRHLDRLQAENSFRRAICNELIGEANDLIERGHEITIPNFEDVQRPRMASHEYPEMSGDDWYTSGGRWQRLELLDAIENLQHDIQLMIVFRDAVTTEINRINEEINRPPEPQPLRLEHVLDEDHRYYKCICRGCRRCFGLDLLPYRRPGGCGHYMCENCQTRMTAEKLGCLGCDAEGRKSNHGEEGEFICDEEMQRLSQVLDWLQLRNTNIRNLCNESITQANDLIEGGHVITTPTLEDFHRPSMASHEYPEMSGDDWYKSGGRWQRLEMLDAMENLDHDIEYMTDWYDAVREQIDTVNAEIELQRQLELRRQQQLELRRQRRLAFQALSPEERQALREERQAQQAQREAQRIERRNQRRAQRRVELEMRAAAELDFLIAATAHNFPRVLEYRAHLRDRIEGIARIEHRDLLPFPQLLFPDRAILRLLDVIEEGNRAFAIRLGRGEAENRNHALLQAQDLARDLFVEEQLALFAHFEDILDERIPGQGQARDEAEGEEAEEQAEAQNEPQ